MGILPGLPRSTLLFIQRLAYMLVQNVKGLTICQKFLKKQILILVIGTVQDTYQQKITKKFQQLIKTNNYMTEEELKEFWIQRVSEREKTVYRDRAKKSLGAIYSSGFTDEEIAFRIWKKQKYG